MPETETEMLHRLEAIASDGFATEILAEDITAIRWAVATIERYRTALERSRPLVYHTCASEPRCRGCAMVSIFDAALSPDPPASAETEATK